LGDILVDANVLIDYCSSNNVRSVLRLIAHQLGPLYVPGPVLSQVHQLSKQQCARLGLILVEPTLEQMVQASERPWRLSFEDALCVLLARTNKWTCLTNDRRILQVCSDLSVKTWRGFRPMIELVRTGALDSARAAAAAEDIRRSNPFHITPAIVQDFRRQIGLP